jgi:hypothetical protein
MGNRTDLAQYLLAWIIMAGIIVWRSQSGRHRGVGLASAYCFQLWLLYWMPALLHYLPWSELPEPEVTLLGLEQSTYALGALLIGNALAGPLFARQRAAEGLTKLYSPDSRLAGAYIIAGLISFTILNPILRKIPSISALAGLGQQLIIVGFCLSCWRAWREGSKAKMIRLLVPLLLMPFATVVGSGFLGYGFMTISVVFIFCAQFFRPRYLLVLGSLVVGYLGLSLYVTYMRDRTDLRETVWGGAALSARIGRFAETLGNFELFDAHKPAHLEAVDGRLNQGALVGDAVIHLQDTGEFAKGASIWDAGLAMIPRILWPGKTVYAGSGNWVTRFTGIAFDASTAVGIGQILEFYGNFGAPGVVIGFLIFGLVLGALDMAAASRLAANDWHGFAFAFVVGTSLLNAGGSLVEVTGSAVSCVVLMLITNSILAGYQVITHRLLEPPRAPLASRYP